MALRLSLFAILFSTFSFALQFQLSDDAEISVLTFGPGKSLNDAFGHNAFRIKDRTLGIDAVYGYGEYDFDAPNFYLKFARGKLNYLISKDNFSDTYSRYTFYDRSITEQVLNLSKSEKQKLYDFLENNYKPENRRYLYDFFFDNCATRIRDVAQIATNKDITFSQPENFEKKTYRQLIYEHVDKNSWGSLGIDIALGSKIDRSAPELDYMFLPKYINSFFDNAKVHKNVNLVKTTNVLYKKRHANTKSNILLSPLVIFGLLGAIIIYLTYLDWKNQGRTKWLDLLIFSLTGLIGIPLLLLWFATDHTQTVQNYNILWAFPLNIFAIGQLMRRQAKKWFIRYIKFLIIMLCLMTMHWLIGVQVFAIGLIPLLLAMLTRYIFLLKSFAKA